MTYEEYQQAIIANIEAIKETRRHQQDEQRQFNIRIMERTTEVKQRYIEERKAIADEQRAGTRAIADKWKAERVRLHIEHTKVIDQWHKERNGNHQAPFVALPSAESLYKEGGEL